MTDEPILGPQKRPFSETLSAFAVMRDAFFPPPPADAPEEASPRPTEGEGSRDEPIREGRGVLLARGSVPRPGTV